MRATSKKRDAAIGVDGRIGPPNAYEDSSYEFVLTDDVWRKTFPEQETSLCIPSIAVQRSCQPDNVEEAASCSNGVRAPKLGSSASLNPQGHKRLSQVYLGCPVTLSFFEVVELMTPWSGQQRFPYWDDKETPRDCWALWADRRDPYAVVLHRFFEARAAALSCVFRAAATGAFRRKVPPAATDYFDASYRSLLSIPIRARTTIRRRGDGLALLPADAAWRTVLMLVDKIWGYAHDHCPNPSVGLSAQGHYDPGAAFVGSPSRSTLEEVRNLLDQAIQF